MFYILKSHSRRDQRQILSNRIFFLAKALKFQNLNLTLNLCLPVTPADNLGKQFGPKSGPTIRPACSGSKLFNILMVFFKNFFKKVNFEKKSADDKKA